MDENFGKLTTEFQRLYPDRKIIFFMIAGSHFFNLNGENSDKDYRAIFLPSKEECKKYYKTGRMEGKIIELKTNKASSGVKNGSNDVDCTFFSFFEFLNLLSRGDFNCIEMLHAPADKILKITPLIIWLMAIRKSLIVNDISCFLGFIKSEYRKYGVNINHLKYLQEFYDFIDRYHGKLRLSDIWIDMQNYFEHSNYIKFTTSKTGSNNTVLTVKIAQRFFQATCRLDYIKDQLLNVISQYGHRQKSTAEGNTDVKGLYHAVRLIYEAEDIFKHGELKLPFSKHRHGILHKIKNGLYQREKLDLYIENKLHKILLLETISKCNKANIEDVCERIKLQILSEILGAI